MIMQRLFGTVCGLSLGFSGAAWADSAPAVVVELYTSQGCSACPPADELLAELADDPHVLALALHVDYWDYIGWTDHFGQAAFTARQKAYARAAGSRMLYTPQFIIDGSERVEGNQPARVQALIAQQLGTAEPNLTLTREGEKVHVQAAAASLSQPVQVQVVRFRPEMTVEIERGENAGKSIAYRNIVTDWQIIGDWDGRTPLDLQATAGGQDRTVVILQAPGPGPVVAAERLN